MKAIGFDQLGRTDVVHWRLRFREGMRRLSGADARARRARAKTRRRARIAIVRAAPLRRHSRHARRPPRSRAGASLRAAAGRGAPARVQCRRAPPLPVARQAMWHTHFFRSRIVTRIDTRSAPPTTNVGQADRASLSGGANTAVTLKRRNAIRDKPAGLTSSGNPLQRARLSGKRGAVPSSQPSSSSAAARSDPSKAQSPPKPADPPSSLLEATPAELQTVAHIPVLQPAVLHSASPHEGNLIDPSDPPPAPKPAGSPPSLLEATPDELQAVAHHPVLQPTVPHAAHAQEGNLIEPSDPPPTPKPAGSPPSLLEATPGELQAVAHHPVLQPTVPHATHAHEGNLIDLSDAPPATQPAQAQPAPLGASHGSHGVHSAHGAPAFAASGMPSVQQIEHETRQAIVMQRAISFANQLLAVTEMINGFRMKLVEMIRKAVSS
ncbi:hypothetical protein [Burkholderia stagnalis]